MKQSDWLKIRSGCDILIYVAWQGGGGGGGGVGGEGVRRVSVQ